MNVKQHTTPEVRNKKSVMASTLQLARSAVKVTVALSLATVTLTFLAMVQLAEKQRTRRSH